MQEFNFNFKPEKMKNPNNKINFLMIVGLLCFCSCEDYLELEVPSQKIISKTVFNNDATAQSAMVGIYNQASDLAFSSGGPSSITVLAGLSADDLSPIYETSIPYVEFDRHEISPDNPRNLSLWSSAYNLIYTVNSLLEGITNSSSLSEEVRKRLEGESKFIRAFTYFYLVNLYGDIPLVTSIDYQKNSVIPKTAKEEVYDKIIEDISDASRLLNDEYSSGERTQVTRSAALALQARVQLFLQNWEEAEEYSSEVIASNQYQILPDLNEVFLKNSEEAIWQFSPHARGLSLTNTPDGGVFIIDPFLYFLAELQLNDAFIESFNPEDQRLNTWIGFNDGLGVHFPYKYKIQNSIEPASEYSMVLRLAEQYLIRAEARARMGNLDGAISDLDVIRERAGLRPVKVVEPNITQNELISLIIEERNKELFSEWGHRWLDLKRTNKAEEVFSNSTGWESTDFLYPIPESELMKNPNLTQNEGY